MQRTNIDKSERVIRIYIYLLSHPTVEYTVKQIKAYINQFGKVSLRNVQRDLKLLTKIREAKVFGWHGNKAIRYFTTMKDRKI